MSNPQTPLAQWLRKCIRDKRRTSNSTRAKCTLSEAWVTKHAFQSSCPLTGLPLVVAPGIDPYSPSIDRIDPRKPYTDDNCRVISLFANQAKNRWSDDVFRLLVFASASHMRSNPCPL